MDLHTKEGIWQLEILHAAKAPMSYTTYHLERQSEWLQYLQHCLALIVHSALRLRQTPIYLEPGKLTSCSPVHCLLHGTGMTRYLPARFLVAFVTLMLRPANCQRRHGN